MSYTKFDGELDAPSGAAAGFVPFAGALDGEPPKKRTWGQAAADTGVQLAEGVNTIAGAVPSLVAPDSGVAGFFRDNAESWRAKQSDVLQGRANAASAAIDKAGEDGVISQVVEAAKQYSSDPALAARFVTTNLPSMIPGIGAAKLAQAAALARGASAVGAASLATTAAGGVNSVLNAGGARGEAFEDIKKTLESQGRSPEEATQLALDKSRLPAAIGGVTGFISGKTGLEGALTGKLSGKVAAAATELFGEQLEEVAPKLATNYQASEYDNRAMSKDVGRTIVETAIGSGPGAIYSGMVSTPEPKTPQQAVADIATAPDVDSAIKAAEEAVNAGPKVDDFLSSLAAMRQQVKTDEFRQALREAQGVDIGQFQNAVSVAANPVLPMATRQRAMQFVTDAIAQIQKSEAQDVGTVAPANPVDSGIGGQLGDNATGGDTVRGRVADSATGPGAQPAGEVLVDGQQDAPVRVAKPEQSPALIAQGNAQPTTLGKAINAVAGPGFNAQNVLQDPRLIPMSRREQAYQPPQLPNVQNATPGTPAQAQAAPVEAPKDAGVAAVAQAVPAAPGSAGVEAAGVKTLSKMLTLKSTTLMRDDGNGRRLYDVAVSPEFRNKHFVNGRMPVVDGLELKPKSDVTGNVYDRGWVLIDNREQLANRRGNDVKQEIGGETGEGSVSNGTLDNPRPVTLPVNKPEGPVFYGTGHRLLTEGGKPFKTKRAADDAKRLQPMMRVKKVKGGYVLTEKTPAQIAAQARAAARLAAGSTGDAGMPQHAHGFMAREGGLSKEAMSDLGLDRNQRIGSMWLFKANGGMTLEQATEKLVEGGYLKEGASHSDAINLIKKSITTPQYTADGWERIAQAEADARFEDHLAAQEESAQNEDFDPFASSLDEGFDLSHIDGVGYDEASDPIKLEVNALLAQAESLGIDTESIRENEYENTKNGSEQDYFEAFKRALASAIEAGNRDSSPDSGEQGNAAGENPNVRSGVESPGEAVAQSSGKSLEAGQKDIDLAKSLTYKLPYLEQRLVEGLDPTDGFDMHILANSLPESIAYNRMMMAHNGDFQGIEFKKEDSERYAFVLPDASNPGSWRVSYFDKNGFSRHESEPTREKAQQTLAIDGFTVEDKGALDRFAETKEWAIGTAFGDLIMQLNKGMITHAQFLDLQQKLNNGVDAQKQDSAEDFLVSPSREDILARQQAEQDAAKAKEAADKAKAALQQDDTAENAIRKSVDDSPHKTIGSWHPISVTHNGVTQQFLFNIKRIISDGKGPQVIHLKQIKEGRIISSDDKRPLVHFYKLDRSNSFDEEGIPRYADDRDLKQWSDAFNAGLTAPTPAEVIAQQERKDNAEALDDKEQIDKEAELQTLTIQNAPDQRKDNTSDMFGEDKAKLEAAKREADAIAKNEAAKDPNQSGMFDEPVAETQSDEDWMQTLFGGSPQTTTVESASKLDAPALRKLIQSLVTDLQAQRADWESREYKGNAKRVNLRGDGPSNQESLSITSINEGRRTKVLQSIDSQLKQLDKLDALIETTAGANEFMQLLQSTWDKAQAFKPQSPDQLSGAALFESLMIDALKLQPAQGSYTSLPITKALREMMDSGKAEPAAKATAILDAAEVKGKERIDVLKDVKSGTITPEEVQAAYPAKEAAKIEDSGAVLEGARKLYAKAYDAKLSEGMQMDTAANPLTKTWPEPDYAKLLEGGADPWAVAFAHAARDEIPKKPMKGWKLKGWVTKVEMLRDMANKVLSGEGAYNKANVQTKIQDRSGLGDWMNKIDMYEAVGHEYSLKDFTFSSGSYSVYGGQHFSPAKTLWAVTSTDTNQSYGNWGKEWAVGETKDAALTKFKDAFERNPPAAKDSEKVATKFDVYSRRGVTGTIIGKKIGKNHIDLKTFPTSKEALAYLEKNQKELESLLEAAKEVQPERRENNSPRIGADHRMGANVSTEQFRETFGFRGEQFGASMPQAERQANLNESYDALMDLAGILNIPPKALSLNGELGLAFGSRGKGGKRAAAAHYERDTTGQVTPNRVVINLTREHGAGSLAHEWFHAVDNYFARMRGEKAGMLTEKPYPNGEGVRPEMVMAFRDLMKAITSTGVMARSRNLDKKRTKDYWSTGLEMAARSFESYVIAKLHEQNAANDYLANIVPEESYLREEEYPYPKAAEMPPIREAFDKFFSIVQTKETDSGVAMFSRNPFFSALYRGIEGIKANVAPANGWKDAIKGLVNKGIAKADEVEWSGLNDWLDLQTGKVQKADLLAFMNAHGVKVTETVLGDTSALQEQARLEAQRALEKEGYSLEFDPIEGDALITDPDGEFVDWDELPENLAQAIDRASDTESMAAKVQTKYSQYTLPGGDNYREVLLTLPERATVDQAERRERRNAALAVFPPTVESRAILEETRGDTSGANNYKSSHWDQKNVLAHIRVNDRTDADGKRVLFVEEIQSDWGQDGKKKGFSEPEWWVELSNGDKEYYKNEQEANRIARENNTDAHPVTFKAGKVPVAPFIGKTDAWLNLALKRIITIAVDGGYDKVAFINGEQSADRYDLSKQVDQIRYIARPDGKFDVWAADENGSSINDTVDKQGLTPDQIEDFVGKDVAKKIVYGAGRKDGSDMVLEGLDLKVGGEGMKKFYDAIVPNAVNALLKKVGGGKLENVEVYRQGQQGRVLPGDAKNAARRDSRLLDQPGFTITNALREKASEGLPLFQRGDGLDAFRASLSKLSAPPATDPKVIAQVQAWTDELSAKWTNAPDIRVVASSADLPVPATSDTRGLYYRGTVYLVAGRVGSKRAVGEVLAHESVAHYGLREMLGKDDWQRFMGNIQLAIKSGNKPLNAIRDEIRSVYVDENGKPNLTPDEEADEIAARVVEKAIDANGEFKPGFAFVKSVYAKIMQFLRDLGLNVKMTHLELQGALINAQRYLEIGNRSSGGGYPLMIAARGDAKAARNDQTQTPEFKRWFGDSVVTDNGKPMSDGGKPLVVYHGTGVNVGNRGEFMSGDFNTFDGGLSGKSSKTGAPDGSFFFTDKPDVASSYTVAWRGDFSENLKDGANVMPVYIAMSKPLKVNAKGENWREILYKGEYRDLNEIVQLAKESGKYDGVIVSKVIDKGVGATTSKTSTTYVAFNPTQIKSATGNNGNFDPTNPDIRFARGTNEPMTNNDVVGNQGGRSADDSTPGDTIELFHGSPESNLSGVDDRYSLFGGVFASASERSANSHGDNVYKSALPASGVLTQHDLDYEIANEDVAAALKKAMPGLSEEDYDTAYKAAIEDLSHKVDDDDLMRVFRSESVGEASWEAQRIRGQVAKTLGFKAVEMDDEHGTSYLLLPGVKLSPANEPTAPDSFGAAMASRARIVGQTTRQHTPEQIRAMENVGFKVEVPTLKERIQSLTQDMGKKMAQGIVDQFAPVKDLDSKAYGLLRLAKGASGAFEAMLKGGQLKITDGVYDFDDTKKGGVVDRLLIPLGGEHHDFFRWIAANRAERLQAEGKENLFSAQDIAALKTLDQGTAEFDYTIQNGANKGKVTRERTLIYDDSLITFNEFNTNVLNMAEQSGLIDGASRKLWEHEFYVPFYRVAEEGEGINGMNIKGAAVRQQAFKKLKGGKQALNADLLDNTLMNWAHLIDASAKNRAAKATIEAAERMGVAVGGNQSTLEQMASSIGLKSNVTWFMDDGIKRYSLVEDPYILTAISSLQYAGMKNPVMNAMSFMKHALTVGVTASPFFKIRNLIRDSVQVIGTSTIDANPAKNIAQGWKLTDPKSDDYFRLLAGGGTIHFGTMMEGSESKRIQALVESGVDSGTILNDGQKVKAFYRKWVEPGITAYNELGNRGEAVNRAALYQQLRSQGIDHAEASLMARDLMDFSMQGSWASIRFLTQIVPFLNARLQGMYKLGRAAKEDPQRFGATLGAVAAVSLGLIAAYGDDDDWRRREDWDRNGFWWFKFGGTAFRIPKPFEIGAIATLAERGFELAFDKEMTNKRFMAQVMTIAGDNLSMNPIPQLVKPLLDVYANKDSFSGRPIETMSMERLKSEYRFTQNTSMTARAVSTGINAVTGIVNKEGFSPVQIDHMLRGYFGWLGSFIVGAADVLARPATDQPDKATPDYWKVATGGIVSDLRDAPSRYVSQMYAQAKDIEQAYGTWKSLVKEGKIEESRDFFEGHKEEISAYRNIERVKSAESKLNERIRMIERSAMNPDKKRELIRELQKAKEQRAKVLQPA